MLNKILLALLIFYIGLNAQSLSIRGKVTDTLQTPIPGVNVMLKGFNIGAASGTDGNYEIQNLEPGFYSLSFSAIGYEKVIVDKIILTTNSLVVNVQLVSKIVQSDQVLITAGKYKQNISDLPISAEIISPKTISKRNLYNLENVLRYVSGINMTQDQISIRGSSGYSRGAGSRVLLAIDGIPFYTGDTGETIWEIIPTTVIERVEVIKGAASSLYGSSAIGGVINVITNKPAEISATYFKTFFGAYDKPHFNEWDWSGEYRTFNGLTISHSNTVENFGFNLSLTRLEDLSYKQSGFSKKYIGFLKAVYSFTPTSSLNLIVNSLNKRSGNFLYWKNSLNALVPPDADQGQRVETDRYLFGLTYSDILNENLLVTVRTSYYRTYWEDGAAPLNQSSTNLFRGEIQTNYNLEDDFILVSGIEASGAEVNSTLFGKPDYFSVGGYSQLDFKFSFPLSVTTGVRYDYSKLDSLSGSSAISPKLGVNYKVTDQIILRSSMGTGFRAPSLAESFTSTTASGITVRPNPKLKSETNLTMEAGINYKPSETLQFDFSVFQNEYFDFIEANLTADNQGNSFVIFDNVTRARIQGYEINNTINLFSGRLKINLNYSYLWARDLEKKKTLKYRPRHTFYSGMETEQWKIILGTDFRYWSRVEEIDTELINLGLIPDGSKRVEVFLLDAHIGYELKFFNQPVKLFFNVNNILNYNYVELIGNLQPIRNASLSAELTL